MGHLIWLAVLQVIAFASCASDMDVGLDGTAEDEPKEAIGKEITGIVITADQEEFDLAQDLEKDVLALIFAQESCYSCIQEAGRAISQAIDRIGRPSQQCRTRHRPSGFADDCKNSGNGESTHNIQWTLAKEKPGQNLPDKYFPDYFYYPAFVIQVDGKITYQRVGALGVEELQKKTGEWE